MSKASGLVLILSGLAVGAYGILESNDIGEPGPLRPQTDIAKTRAGEERSDVAVVSFARRAMPLPQRASEESAFSAPVVVTLAPHLPGASVQGLAIPKDRDVLARELQKELRRVGCYDGEVNGAWTPATRRAMKAFTDRVNATLPIEQPDPILYVMVRGQRDQVCGTPCPAGQGFSEDGRCLPLGILAKATGRAPTATATVLWKPNLQGAEKPGRGITGWSTTSTAGVPAIPPPLASAPVDGRMALAGPASLETAPATGAPPAAGPRLAPVLREPRPRVVSAARSSPNWSRAVFASGRSPN